MQREIIPALQFFYAIYYLAFVKMVMATMMIIAPINSVMPKFMFKKIMDKIIEEKGSSEAKTPICVGVKYLVLSR